MKTWKTHIIIDGAVPKLMINETTDGLYYERNFSSLSDLTSTDIDGLIKVLQEQQLQLAKLAEALK